MTDRQRQCTLSFLKAFGFVMSLISSPLTFLQKDEAPHGQTMIFHDNMHKGCASCKPVSHPFRRQQ